MDEAEESTKNHKGTSIKSISIVAILSLDTSEMFFNTPIYFSLADCIVCLEMLQYDFALIV